MRGPAAGREQATRRPGIMLQGRTVLLADHALLYSVLQVQGHV